MKAMKSMNVNRMLGSLKRKPREGGSEAGSGSADAGLDTPEANAARNVRLFCESGGPNGSGEEVLYLPTIVESCESSPSAAKEAAYHIRKFLSKDMFNRPYVQYNAIMLIRILADNPGKTFTRNVDAKFVQVVKELLRLGRDPSVKQILMETLATFQRDKANDEGLALLNEMWRKEHERMTKLHGLAAPFPAASPAVDQNQNYFSRNHRSRHLPPPHELSSRIEEARNSAQVLSQIVQSTPPSDIIENELVREFANRCQSASRSIQAYMIAENPSPDNDTMETLIETNELLGKAMNQHQRAVLNARKAAGLGGGEGTTPPTRTDSGFALPPPNPPPGRTDTVFAAPPGPPPNHAKPPSQPRKTAPPIPPPGDYAPVGDDEDPFKDPAERPLPGSQMQATHNPPFPGDAREESAGTHQDRLGMEPWHPGFKETKSYVGRQDSSVGNVTMHAGVPEAPDREKDEELGEYGTQASKKAPVYRY